MLWQGVVGALALLVVFSNGKEYTHEEKVALTKKSQNLPNNNCGIPEINDVKITGGTEAKLGAYPWMAALGYTLPTGKRTWQCGGSLITNQYVVTAAHCLDPKRLNDTKLTTVRLGDLDLSEYIKEGASPRDFGIEKTIIHPEYFVKSETHDIGLIKLKTKAEYNNVTKPICLPSPEFYRNTFIGSSSKVAGWGFINRRGVRSDALMETNLDILNCTNFISKMPFLNERVICASSNIRDTCGGDSGGPLMMFDKSLGTGKLYLFGVVSHGYSECGQGGLPGVYTKVPFYIDWIIENLEF